MQLLLVLIMPIVVLILPPYALWSNLIYKNFVKDFEISIKLDKIFSLH